MSAASFGPRIPIETPLEHRALEIWNEQQKDFPKFVRRHPDHLDLVTGAWARVLDLAFRPSHPAHPKGE